MALWQWKSAYENGVTPKSEEENEKRSCESTFLVNKMKRKINFKFKLNRKYFFFRQCWLVFTFFDEFNEEE